VKTTVSKTHSSGVDELHAVAQLSETPDDFDRLRVRVWTTARPNVSWPLNSAVAFAQPELSETCAALVRMIGCVLAYRAACDAALVWELNQWQNACFILLQSLRKMRGLAPNCTVGGVKNHFTICGERSSVIETAGYLHDFEYREVYGRRECDTRPEDLVRVPTSKPSHGDCTCIILRRPPLVLPDSHGG
jgi:hypothetical protein